jgi:nitrous oxidase accessory protein
MKRVALTAALALALPGGAPTADAAEVGGLPVVGPRDVPESATATPAASFDALQALVADPNGPREIELVAGVHVGDLVIKRPVAVRGRRGAVLEGTGHGTVVAITASDVAVENVVIRKSGRRHTSEDSGVKAKGDRVRIADVSIEDALFGIDFAECHDCAIERSHVVGTDDDPELRGDGIKLWESHGTHVTGCLVERARDVVVWYTRHATLEGNVVRGSRYGTHFMYAHDAVLRKSRFEDDVVGVFVMYSQRLTIEDNVLAGARGAAGVGLGFKDSDAITLRRNWLVANTTGTYLDNTPRTAEEPVVFEANVVALNDVAVRLHMSQTGVHVVGNDFRDNAAVIEVDGQGDALGADFRGNHYSDYAGYDLDGDGVGDVAYEVKTLSSELTESHPTLKLFTGTAALGVIDAVAHAVPVLSAKKLLRDPSPRVAPLGGAAP